MKLKEFLKKNYSYDILTTTCIIDIFIKLRIENIREIEVNIEEMMAICEYVQASCYTKYCEDALRLGIVDMFFGIKLILY